MGGLQPNETYQIINTPVCPDGQLSSFSIDGLGTTLIVEILVQSFGPSQDKAECAILQSADFCWADPPEGNIVTFKVGFLSENSEIEEFRYFGFYHPAADCDNVSIVIRPEDNASPFEFMCETSSVPNEACEGTKILISYDGEPVANVAPQLEINEPKKLAGNILVANYYIERMGDEIGNFYGAGTCPGGGGGRQGTQDIPKSNSYVSISPNPFGNLLELSLDHSFKKSTFDLSLYNLQGRPVKHLTVTNGATNIQLNTENLDPGMYFLKVEAEAFSETLKVVKAQ